MVVLSRIGNQAPTIPLVEVVGKAVKACPEQIAATGAKVGVTVELIVMVTVSKTVIGLPQLLAVLVAVKVKTMVPEALAGTK